MNGPLIFKWVLTMLFVGNAYITIEQIDATPEPTTRDAAILAVTASALVIWGLWGLL